MTCKVRIEFLTLVGVGAEAGVESDQPLGFFGAQELSATGLTGVTSEAAPDFGVAEGNAVTTGVARITNITGTAIVAVGSTPTSDTGGIRLASGQGPLDLPITTGQTVGLCEATD